MIATSASLSRDNRNDLCEEKEVKAKSCGLVSNTDVSGISRNDLAKAGCRRSEIQLGLETGDTRCRAQTSPRFLAIWLPDSADADCLLSLVAG